MRCTRYPAYQVIPCFAGYQDAPWDTTLSNEPPNETYSFQFFSREGGEYGYPDRYDGGYDPNTQAALASYPFFGVEYGGGTASMYRRRCDMALPDDIAATVPVQLGSGVNMYGYYMFHGGRNPRGETETLQESTATGGYNDLPVINYDYQAPLGQYGDQKPSLGRVKGFHYFLGGFGPDLAAMTFRQPAQIPNGAGDLATLRWPVRSDGRSGYLFVNNYVRQYAMAAHPGTQFSVKFADETITLPSEGADIAPGAYFIWPLNLAMGGARLKYAAAQLVTLVRVHGRTCYVFIAQDGIDPEFAFAAETVAQIQAGSARVRPGGAGQTVVSGITPGLDVAISVTATDGTRFDVLVLSQQQADQLWRVSIAGRVLADLARLPGVQLRHLPGYPGAGRSSAAGRAGWRFRRLPGQPATTRHRGLGYPDAPLGRPRRSPRAGRLAAHWSPPTRSSPRCRAPGR